MFMWADESVFYQIYPLGFCGAPEQNDGQTVARIKKVEEWIPHILKLGCNAVYFSPVFSSDAHGYDTRDYSVLDCRLGTNADFAQVCAKLHENGIRIVLDGVFNHVGRGFWAFKDVIEHRESSRYRDWFYINFSGNSAYNDGFWYEGWEGHFELVKLNLDNPEVREHLFNCVQGWASEFNIDGLRLDVAYCLNRNFLRELRGFCNRLKPEFFLVGEMLHGDYNQLVNNEMLHSCTNYECYKGLYSAFNSKNLFEIAHSLMRQFGPEQWTLYKGKNLLCFVDNHDVTRVASILTNPEHLPLIYALLCAMPGIPCIYYGSEWGAQGTKGSGSDAALRASFEAPLSNGLTDFISRCINAHKESKALCFGGYQTLCLTNEQLVFQREAGGEKMIIAINAASNPFTAHFNAGAGEGIDVLSGNTQRFENGAELPPYSAFYWKV